MSGRKEREESAAPGAWSTSLAAALYHPLSVGAGNFAFSPWSVSVALAMLQAGAGGETRRELEAALGHPGAGDALVDVFAGLVADLTGGARSGPAPVELSLASALWCREGYPLRPELVEDLRRKLGAETREADFARGPAEAARRVNHWIAAATRRRIPEILSESQLPSLTRVLLVNAFYFNAPWLYPFFLELTHPAPFHVAPGTRVEVPTMHRSASYRYARRGDVQALEVPYRADRFAMVILLPDEGKLESVQRETGAREVEALIAAMASEETLLGLPRFRVPPSGLSLRSPLEAIGVRTAFGTGADFSGLSSEPGFAPGDVVHGAFVDVDERGTEAAAATTVVMAGASRRPPKRIDFRVDRPFLFLMRDRPTGTILFMGRVVDPRR